MESRAARKLFSGQEKSNLEPHPPPIFFLGFTLISDMIKITPKMAEINQLAENLEPCLSQNGNLILRNIVNQSSTNVSYRSPRAPEFQQVSVGRDWTWLEFLFDS